MKTTTKKFIFLIEKTNSGFSAFSNDLPVFTTGKTISELYTNILESINLYFEEDDLKIRANNIRLDIDLKQFFSYYRVLNAKFLAHRIGMNESLLSQYVKGHKKPSSKQLDRILNGLHEIGQELSEINLISI